MITLLYGLCLIRYYKHSLNQKKKSNSNAVYGYDAN